MNSDDGIVVDEKRFPRISGNQSGFRRFPAALLQLVGLARLPSFVFLGPVGVGQRHGAS